MAIKVINYKNYKYKLDCDGGICFQINEFDEHNEIVRFIILSYNYDIGFKLFDVSDEIYEEVEKKVIIDDENPFYHVFLELLNNEDELLIDDDFCNGDFLRYIKFKKENDRINIVFHDEKSKNSIDGFTVTIKNVCFDLRSKIDQQELDTKKQLKIFFNNIYKIFDKENNKQKIKTL